MTPEGRVKAKVKRALEALDASYRFMPVQNGMGAPGLDFYCCVKGFFVAVETKVPGKRLTPRQRETAKAISAALGVVFVIRDQGDIDHMVHELQNRSRLIGVIHDRLWEQDAASVGATEVLPGGID